MTYRKRSRPCFRPYKTALLVFTIRCMCGFLHTLFATHSGVHSLVCTIYPRMDLTRQKNGMKTTHAFHSTSASCETAFRDHESQAIKMVAVYFCDSTIGSFANDPTLLLYIIIHFCILYYFILFHYFILLYIIIYYCTRVPFHRFGCWGCRVGLLWGLVLRSFDSLENSANF